jgi:hypothetical protein
VGEKAENQQKTREKSKIAENQVFWLDFCAKIKDCAYTLRRGPEIFLSADCPVSLSLLLHDFCEFDTPGKRTSYLYLYVNCPCTPVLLHDVCESSPPEEE